MKLSDAILLGAMSKPQGEGSRSSYSSARATCALGAAAFASGIDCGMSYEFRARFPILSKMVVNPSTEAGTAMRLYLVIMHLNDFAKWTRERIAAWVATLEAQQEVQAEVQRVAEPAEVVCA